MKLEDARRQVSDRSTRNPFGIMDVPNPNDEEVLTFAASTKLVGTSDDGNAIAWATLGDLNQHDTIEGNWCSRWKGGADPTIPADTENKWKQGRAEVRTLEDRVYILFDWKDGARKGLIDAHREGTTRLVGKYINLTDPKITRSWVGLVVSNQRIDGQWSGGRLDFRMEPPEFGSCHPECLFPGLIAAQT
jgi:hypothetical protein